jgi:HK97 family phage portal protein
MAVWARPGPRGDRRQALIMGSSGPTFSVAGQSFADINAARIETAMQSVAISAATDLIASLGSELPVRVYRGRGANRVELPVPRHLEDPGGDGYGLPDWSYQALMSWLYRGNLYGQILERAPIGETGYLKTVVLFHPDRVSGWLGDDGRPNWAVAGAPDIPRSAFLHRRVNPLPGQVLGLSPISYHAVTIGVNLASQQFGWQWFRDGAHPSAILQSTEREVNKTLADEVKSRFMAALRGRREPLVIDRGWKYERVQITPEESQFIETMGFTAAECARLFGPGIAEVLGYAVKGASLTYSNIQDRGLHLLTYALNKWLKRLERLLSEFLPRPQYAMLDRDALLETNTLQRFQSHQIALAAKFKTINEVREREHLPPVDWGEVPAGAEAPPPPTEPEPEPTGEPTEDEE